MSQNLNVQPELTAEELALITTYRAGGMEAVAEIAAQDKSLTVAPEIQSTCPHEELDSAERLALHVIGDMALGLCLTRSMLLDDGLITLWRDTTAAIKSALPRLDMVEIERISREGK